MPWQKPQHRAAGKAFSFGELVRANLLYHATMLQISHLRYHYPSPERAQLSVLPTRYALRLPTVRAVEVKPGVPVRLTLEPVQK